MTTHTQSLTRRDHHLVNKLALGTLLALGGYLLTKGVFYRRSTPAAPTEAGRTLLNFVLPNFEFRGQVSTTIQATPTQILTALRQVTLADMPFAHLLGELRYLPARLAGKIEHAAHRHESFFELVEREGGNIVLAEEPQREVVIGTVGKLHNLTDQHIVPLWSAEAFANFTDPTYQKLAISLRIEEGDPNNDYRVVLEHRTHALGWKSRQKFALYWLLIKPGGALVSRLLLNAIKRRAEAKPIVG